MCLKLVVLVFLIGVVHSQRSDSRLKLTFESKRIDFYVTVTAYTPRGLRVSIEHRNGLEMYSFHGRINSTLSASDGGNLAQDITRHTNGQWVFEDRYIKLNKGDVLNFWIFIQFEGDGERFTDLQHRITKLSPVPLGWSELESSNGTATTPRPSIYPRRTTTPRSTGGEGHRKTEIRTTTTARPPAMLPEYGAHEIAGATNANNESEQPQCVCNESILQDLWTQLNTTVGKVSSLEENITPLQNKVDSLMETIDELTKNINIGTKLRLVGNLPMHSNPAEDVRYLLIEKLKLDDLSNNILQAEYKENGVSFEMSSSIDKLRILKRSKDILSKLPYQIIDPDNPKIDIRISE